MRVTQSRVFYNDNDPHVCRWLRNLMARGLIPWGVVDERDIRDLQAEDLQSFTQVHLFAGIAGFAYALQLAGWPPDAPIWTGSCPCQPYSVAGRGLGDEDPRNLWPEFRRLVAQCLPPVCIGEQVASARGRRWLAGVRADLVDLGYAVGAADLPAAGVGAPHKRQRLFWVADRMAYPQVPDGQGRQGSEGGRGAGLTVRGGLADAVGGRGEQRDASEREVSELDPGGPSSRMAHTDRRGQRPGAGRGKRGQEGDDAGRSGEGLGLAHTARGGLGADGGASGESGHHDLGGPSRGLGDAGGLGGSRVVPEGEARGAVGVAGRGLADAGHGDERSGLPVGGAAGEAEGDPEGQERERLRPDPGHDRAGLGALNPWGGTRLVRGRDGRWRRLKPRLAPLVVGVPFRLADGGTVETASRPKVLRAIGNAIVPQVAAQFIRAYMEARR